MNLEEIKLYINEHIRTVTIGKIASVFNITALEVKQIYFNEEEVSCETYIKRQLIKRKIVDDIKKYIDNHFNDDHLYIDLLAMIDKKYMLKQIFMEMESISFEQYVCNKKVDYVCYMLINTPLRFEEIARMCGGSTNGMLKAFERIKGMPPIEYRNKYSVVKQDTYIKRMYPKLSEEQLFHLVDLVIDYILENIVTVNLNIVARNFNCTAVEMDELFTKAVNCSVTEFIKIVRMNNAVEQLLTTTDSCEKIALENGYDTLMQFNAQFKRKYRQTLNEYRLIYGLNQPQTKKVQPKKVQESICPNCHLVSSPHLTCCDNCGATLDKRIKLC